ncbi:MAG: hypothetical protein ISP91_04535 [Pseudomonadales bacterium]|nr:hypothetical protein [Pseudomonadales bacterium]
MATAILLIRSLSVDDYALVTIVVTATTFIVTFSDLGVTEVLGYLKRLAGSSTKSFASSVSEVLRLRTRLMFIGGFLSLGYCAIALTAGDFDVVDAVVCSVIALPSAWFTINAGIRGYPLKLQSRFTELYKRECSQSCFAS